MFAFKLTVFSCRIIISYCKTTLALLEMYRGGKTIVWSQFSAFLRGLVTKYKNNHIHLLCCFFSLLFLLTLKSIHVTSQQITISHLKFIYILWVNDTRYFFSFENSSNKAQIFADIMGGRVGSRFWIVGKDWGMRRQNIDHACQCGKGGDRWEIRVWTRTRARN